MPRIQRLAAFTRKLRVLVPTPPGDLQFTRNLSRKYNKYDALSDGRVRSHCNQKISMTRCRIIAFSLELWKNRACTRRISPRPLALRNVRFIVRFAACTFCCSKESSTDYMCRHLLALSSDFRSRPTCSARSIFVRARIRIHHPGYLRAISLTIIRQYPCYPRARVKPL